MAEPVGPSFAGRTDAPAVNIISAASIHPEAIDWLWGGWLAAGKVHILAGMPGTGKTTIALKMAATITAGGQWPDGTPAPQGDVLMWSGEDGLQDSLVPRLAASGADLTRVHFVGDVGVGKEARPFDPATDMPMLMGVMRLRSGIKLLIIDPIISAVSGDSHKTAEVRRALQPLVDLARDLGVAVLGISHFTKGTAGRDPVERVTGSVAFGALARVVLCTARPVEDGNMRRLLRAKSNIGPDGDGFEYDLVRLPVPNSGMEGQTVEWGATLVGPARTRIAEVEDASDGKTNTALEYAKRFLTDLLAGGPKPATEIKSAAKSGGVSERTLERAKKKLGVEAQKSSLLGCWVWSLPDDDVEVF